MDVYFQDTQKKIKANECLQEEIKNIKITDMQFTIKEMEVNAKENHTKAEDEQEADKMRTLLVSL